MEKYIINYETALKLKEIGFDEECEFIYDETGVRARMHSAYKNTKEDTWNVTAPLYDQVLEWFRSKDYILVIDVFMTNEGFYSVEVFSISRQIRIYQHQFINTYEEARQKGIDWIINKTKENGTVCNSNS